MILVKLILSIFVLFVCSCRTSEKVVEPAATDQFVEIILPEMPTVKLQSKTTIKSSLINESSGLILSRTQENVLWTHNDSGDKARIFAIDTLGEIIKPANTSNYQGVGITNAVNRDWEDITQDDQGHLIIGACGNNDNKRKDLSFYIINEPIPTSATQVSEFKQIRFHYPDQHEFPPEKRNFDAEAIFWANGKIYVLTKHRSDTFTKLYRLDSQSETESNALTYLGRFDIRDQVTGAGASLDGGKLAVLTYSGVWLFEKPEKSDDYFLGKISWLPISARQCEAICFSGDNLIIGNEQRELFEVALSKLVKLN